MVVLLPVLPVAPGLIAPGLPSVRALPRLMPFTRRCPWCCSHPAGLVLPLPVAPGLVLLLLPVAPGLVAPAWRPVLALPGLMPIHQPGLLACWWFPA